MAVRRFVAVTCLVALALGSALPNLGFTVTAAQGAATPETSVLERGPMRMRGPVINDVQESETRLNALVQAMNAAKGEAQVAAMAAVINELVDQHQAMHGRMTRMHEEMMRGRGMGMGGRGMMMDR